MVAGRLSVALFLGQAATGLASGGFLEEDAGIVVASLSSQVITDAAPNALKDCLSVPTFPGKCLITKSPGACYSTDNTAVWQCWVDDQSPDTETDEFCVGEGMKLSGACTYKDHTKKVTDADLPTCFSVPGGFRTQCNPVTDFWGACYKGNSQEWMCIPKASDLIDSLRLDCQVTLMADGIHAYDGACTFGEVKQELYKCDTVPTYDVHSGTSSCLGPPVAPFACFSLRHGVPWQCWTNGTNPSCRTSTTPQGDIFDGACLNKGADGYDDAKDAGTLTTITTTTTTTTTVTTTTTTTKGAAASLTLSLTALVGVFVAAVGQLSC